MKTKPDGDAQWDGDASGTATEPKTEIRALEKRRKLMDAWAAYCEPKKAGNVIQISRA